MKAKSISLAHLFLFLMLSISLLFTSCQKVSTAPAAQGHVTKKNGKGKNLRTTGENLMPTFKEFIFSNDLLDYSTLIYQKKEGITRTLIQYHTSPENVKLFKYILVQTNSDESWSSMYLVSKMPIPKDYDFYKLNIEEDEVINLDRYWEGQEYIVNGVQIKKINYSIDDPITAESDRVAAECEEGEYCVDSWLVTYGEESGIIYYIEYSPICTTVHCNNGSGNGSGNPANPPATCDPTAVYPEQQDFENYVEMSTPPASSIHAPSTSGSGQDDLNSGSFSWTVTKALMGSWRVDAVTNYGYYREMVYNPNTNFLEYSFNFVNYGTGNVYFVGSNTFITSTYTNQSTSDQVFKNNTANAVGKSHIIGTITHTMNVPVRIPFCGPLGMSQTDAVENTLTFSPL